MKEKHFKEGEQLLMRIERAHRGYMFVYLFAIILFSSAGVFLARLLSFGIAGWIIFGVLILLGFLILYMIHVSRTSNVLLVTDQRVVDIDRQGWFKKEITELTLDMIEDVTITRRGFLDMILRLGVVTIVGGRGKVQLAIEHVGNPVLVQELILDAREEYIDQKRYGLHVDKRPRDVVSLLHEHVHAMSYKELRAHHVLVKKRLRQFMSHKSKNK